MHLSLQYRRILASIHRDDLFDSLRRVQHQIPVQDIVWSLRVEGHQGLDGCQARVQFDASVRFLF